MRERRVDLERLARLLHLLLLAQVLDRAQVVEPVSELDQDHADVLRHRHDQLAVVLRLGVLAALELDPRQLGDAVDQLCDLVAELVIDRLQVLVRVLDDVVEQRCGDRLLVEPELGEDLRDPERVVDELLTGAALLPLVGARRERERSRQQVAVELRLVLLDRLDQLVDELLMSIRDLEHGHGHSVLRAFTLTTSRFRVSFRRKRGTHAEGCRTCADVISSSGNGQSCSSASSSCCSSARSPRPPGRAPAALRAARGRLVIRAGSARLPSRRSSDRPLRRPPRPPG